MHGAAPHFQKRREAQINPSGSIESRTRALSAADGRRHLRVAARPAAHASIYSFLSQARGLDAASSGAAAANQCSWKQRLFVAARRHRRCLAAVKQHARRQLKTVCGLRQVRPLRMLIPVRTTSTSAWQIKLFKCNMPKSLRLIALPTAFAEHTTNRSESSLSCGCMMLLSCAALQARDHRPLL